MADNIVNIGVNVSDNGSTAKVTKNVEVLRDLLVNTAAIAAKINVGGGAMPFGGMGAPTGTPRAARTPSAAPASTGGGSAALASAQGGTSGSRALSEQSRYGMFRGVAGEAGSAAGNFAEQAQGANGLVRIYATLAANVYAATAAFAALSKAADISNLTKGLDMLGAASGKNLGAMAKRLVEVTEGGLSLADSMKATAKASSAGISTANIERLGIVAKKSSQALGLDLGSAFDRLSRGVTKLEPELLDELGLFTKIGPSTEAYARSIGKNVTALTDFEKRQAFANAVLDEGEKKFGAIELSTNGYNIILAKLTNGLQTVFEMANKVLKPIIDFLSQNPTALVLALGLLAKVMFSSMVPALTKWKESNKLVTESTQKKIDALREERASMLARRNEILGNSAAMRLQNAEDSRSLNLQKLLSDPNLNPKVKAALTTTSRIGEAGPQAPVTSAVGEITPDRLKVLEQAKRSLEQDIKARAGLYISAPGLAAKQAEDLKHLDEVIKGQKAATLAAKELNKVEAITTASKGETKLLAQERKDLLSLQKSNIVQNSLETQAIDGTIAGFKALRKEVSLARQGFDINGAAFEDSSKRLGFFSATATMAVGSVKLLTGALNALLGTISRILMIIGIVTAVFQILNNIFSTSIKESANFAATTDLLDSALKNVGNTLDNISKKKFLSAESVQQTANAFNDLTDATRKQLKTFTELTTSQNGWDRFWEGIFSEIPGIKSNTDILAQNLTSAIDQSIVLIKDEKLRAEFEKKLSGIYDPSGTKKERIAGLKIAIEGGENIGLITKELDKVNAAINNAASSLTSLDAGFTEISKQVTDIATSTKLTDVEGKLGTSMLAEADRLTKAFKNPEEGLIALSKIVKDVNLITIFPESVSRDLINTKEKILELSAAYQKASVEVTDLELRAKSAQGVDALIVEEQLAKARKVLSTIQASSKTLVSQFDTKVTGGLIEQAFNKVGISLKNAIVEAGIISARGYVSILSSLGANTASMEAALKVKELENQKAVARASYDLSQSLVRNRLAMEILTQTNIEGNALKAIENSWLSKNKQDEDKVKAFTTLQGASSSQSDVNLFKPDLDAIAKALPAGTGKSAESAKTFQAERTAAIAGVTGLDQQQARTSKLILDAIEVIKTPVIDPKQIIADSAKAYAEAFAKRISLESSKKRFFAEDGEGKANPKEIRKGAAETGTEASSIARELYVNMAGLEAVISKLDAQIGVAKLEGQAGNIRGIAKKETELQQRKGGAAADIVTTLKDEEKLLGLYNEGLVVKRQKYEVEVSARQAAEDSIKLNGELKVAELVLGSIKDKTSDAGIKAIETEKELREKLKENEISWTKKERKQDTEQLIERLTGAESLAVIDRERQTKTLEFENNIKQASIANLEADLGMRQALGTVSDKEMAIRTAELSISKQAIDYSQQKLAIENTIAATTAKNIIDRAGLEKSGASTATIAVFDENAKKNLETLNLQKASIDAQNASKLYGIEISKQTQLQLAAEKKILEDQALAMDKLTSLANNLGVVFGDVGKNFGTAMTGILKATQDNTNQKLAIDTKYAKDSTDLQTSKAVELLNLDKDGASSKEDTIQNTLDIEAKYAKKGTALVDKQNRDKEISTMDMYGSEVGAMKGMFDKKTAAYKIFNAVEKGLHLMSMAMKIQGMIMDATATTSSVGNSGIRGAASVVEAGISGVKAVVNAIAAFPPPLNFIAGAITAGVIASLLSSIGGSGPTVSTVGFTAKDQQETQGTGQKWVNGVKTDTGGGVFGDSTAKSNAIEDSLAIIAATSVEGMASSNTMVKLLESINKNIGIAAIQLFSAKGITGGSAFGTVEGKTGGNFLGGLFGSSQSTEILNSGIKLFGTFMDAADGMVSAFQQFETIKTTTEDSLFWSSSTSSYIDMAFKDLNEGARKALGEVFSNARDLFVEQGRKLGKTQESVFASLTEFKFTDEDMASFRDLKGEELVKALNAVISSTIDRTANTLFTELVTKYHKFGETAEVTVTRVLDGNEKVNLALLSIGKAALNAGEVTTDSSIAISQAMIDAAGDLSKFLDQTKFYRDNFVDATTKINATTTNLTERFAALGYTMPKTRAEFVLLKEQFQGNGDAAINLRQQLTDLQIDFDTVASATEATGKLRIELMEAEGNKVGALAARREIEYAALTNTDAALKKRIDQLNDEKALNESRFSQNQKIYSLIGTEEAKRAALDATRAKELDGLDVQLRATQRYIYALEDEATARDKASKAVNSTITSLKGSIKTLEDYQTSLATGAQGAMTPEQKYASLQQDLLATQAAAMGPTDTPEQLAAQQAAAAKLPQAASAFLTSSQALYASTDKYAQDLAGVQSIINDTITSIKGTKTLAEAQLEALGPLASIQTATESTAQLMQDFLAASALAPLAKIGAAASGSVAAGGTYVAPIPVVISEAPVGIVDKQSIANEALAAQVKESNRLLQLQIDQSTALAKANAALTKKIADDAINAAKEAAEVAEYAARNTVYVQEIG